MQAVTMPDGSVEQFPDAATANDIRDFIEAKFPQAVGELTRRPATPQDSSSFEVMDLSRRQAPQPREPAAVDILDMARRQGPGGQQPAPAPPAPEAGREPGVLDSLDAFARAGGQRFLNNAMQLPDLALTTLANVPSPAGLLSPLMPGHQPARTLEELQASAGRTLYQDITGSRPPAIGDRVLPLPSAEQLAAGVDALTSLDVSRYRKSLDEQQQRREAFPTATMLGDFAGDVGSILLGRVPARAAYQSIASAPPAVQRAPTILGRALQHAGKGTRRTLARAAETGGEGAALAYLQDADPSTAAAVGAGASALGSALGAPAKSILRKGLPAAVLTGTIATVGFLELAPGDQRTVLDAFENRSKEAILGVILGGLGARVPGGFAGQRFADLVNVTKRGTLFSLLNSITRDPERTGPVVKKFAEEPEYFGPTARRRLTRAINSQDIDVSNTIDGLEKDRRYRRAFERLRAEQAELFARAQP